MVSGRGGGEIDGNGLLSPAKHNQVEAASFVDVAANGRDDVRAAGARHLRRVAAGSAGRAHHNEALARSDAR